jgi:hypothetical protein
MWQTKQDTNKPLEMCLPCVSLFWCDVWHVTDQTRHKQATWNAVGLCEFCSVWCMTCDRPNTTTQELALRWLCLAQQLRHKQTTGNALALCQWLWCDVSHVTDQTQPPKSWLLCGCVWHNKQDTNKPLEMLLACVSSVQCDAWHVTNQIQPPQSQLSGGHVLHTKQDTNKPLEMCWPCVSLFWWDVSHVTDQISYKQATCNVLSLGLCKSCSVWCWHVTNQTQSSKSQLSGSCHYVCHTQFNQTYHVW